MLQTTTPSTSAAITDIDASAVVASTFPVCEDANSLSSTSANATVAAAATNDITASPVVVSTLPVCEDASSLSSTSATAVVAAAQTDNAVAAAAAATDAAATAKSSTALVSDSDENENENLPNLSFLMELWGEEGTSGQDFLSNFLSEQAASLDESTFLTHSSDASNFECSTPAVPNLDGGEPPNLRKELEPAAAAPPAPLSDDAISVLVTDLIVSADNSPVNSFADSSAILEALEANSSFHIAATDATATDAPATDAAATDAAVNTNADADAEAEVATILNAPVFTPIFSTDEAPSTTSSTILAAETQQPSTSAISSTLMDLSITDTVEASPIEPRPHPPPSMETINYEDYSQLLHSSSQLEQSAAFDDGVENERGNAQNEGSFKVREKGKMAKFEKVKKQCDKKKRSYKNRLSITEVSEMISRWMTIMKFGAAFPLIPLKLVSEYLQIMRLIEGGKERKKYKYTHFSENMLSLSFQENENFFQPQLVAGKSMTMIACGSLPYSKLVKGRQIVIFQFVQDFCVEEEIVKRINNSTHLKDVPRNFCTLASPSLCEHKCIGSFVYSLYVFLMFHEQKYSLPILSSHMKRQTYESIKKYVLNRLQKSINSQSADTFGQN